MTPHAPGDWRYQPAPGQSPWRPLAPPPAASPRRSAAFAGSSPLCFRHVKIAPREIPRMLAEMQVVVERQARNHRLLFALACVVALGLLVVPPIGVLCFAIALIVFLIKRSKRKRAAAKLSFLRALLELLVDELHPRAPIRFDFDLSAYDASGKQYHSRRSSAGNIKSYYSDKWLRLRLVLADRTQVEIVRQQGIKAKKGSVTFEKRRLFVTVTPNPRRYRPMLGQPMADRLRGQLSEEILRGFHNRPELIHVHVAHHASDIGLKIVQEDVDILPHEVLVVLYGTMRHLRDLCVVQPG